MTIHVLPFEATQGAGKECKLELECLQERLKDGNFIRQYIIGSRFDKKFKKSVDRLKGQKELFELVTQVDQLWVQPLEVITDE